MIKPDLFYFVIAACLLYSCSTKKTGINENFHFTLLPSSKTNIDFNNKLTENDSVNFLTNQYVYIGSGVGVADFNNDGLQDVFFAGEQVSCKLYLNKGNFKFDDITKSAGVTTDKWCTGVSIVDINNDGLMDIYVSVSHSANPEKRKNILFINQGNLQFKDEAAEYGLDDAGFSTQAAFFDYDKDGDLDMYLMNHNVFQNQPNNIITQNTQGTSVAADKLYRNEGVLPGSNHPSFKDVSMEAGINDNGYGLGICISDFNKDGWPDVYIANDFLSNDLLWLNNKNGSFTNCIYRSLHHQSYNSMGVDVADINNDQLTDIAVLDMQPETNYRKKTMFAGTNPERYDMEQKIPNYQPQFTRNMLQLNNGNKIGDSLKQPFFSEIAQLSGISETDWSWSVLMADFDNDGWKDIQITNGLAKDLTNNDFLFFRTAQGNNAAEGKTGLESSAASLRKDLDAYGSIKISNYFYHNNGDLTFSNFTQQTGMDAPSISHGAVYADLDNDGDLDLVLNNMNQEAFIWKNELRQSVKDSTHNFLSVQLKGTPFNQSGIGATLTLYAGNKVQLLEQNTTRGYMSSVDSRLHFGIDSLHIIDSLKIAWPDEKTQTIRNIKVNQQITLKYNDAANPGDPGKSRPVGYLFTDDPTVFGSSFKHDEVSYFDFGMQRMVPQKYSQLGPALSTGDVNGDGLTDVFIGGASYQSGVIFLQNKNGSFSSKNLVAKDKTSEDIGSAFFDADGDKDLDLVITEGSSEFVNSTTLNLPRLYKNDGKGNFLIDSGAFPSEISTIAQSISTADFDSDGDQDIFIGGRILANQYPLSPRSYILQNNGGKFKDVTGEVCPALVKPGLVTASIWTDFDNDKNIDLVICGEWMPVLFFKNTKGKLAEVTETTGLKNMNGLWRSLCAVDIDNDGDVDFVAGNMGLNNKYHASATRPSMLYVKDIDGNGSLDLIPAYHIKNNEGAYDLFPGIDRTQLADQVLVIKKKFLLNEDFAKINMKELLSSTGQKDMLEYKCETLASVWIENKGNGKFTEHLLPLMAQLAPVNAIVATDADGDGKIDLIIAGNEYQSEIGTGRYDASFGQFLKNDGNGIFTTPPIQQSGLYIDGDVKNLNLLNTAHDERIIIAAVNNSFLKCIRINPVKNRIQQLN
jgi:enediyne biosynthesis protein E4